MDGTELCVVCGAPVGASEGGTVAGMTLCSLCHAGDFGGRLAARGLRLQCMTKVYHQSGQHGGGSTRHVAGMLPYDTGLTANFSTEDWTSKLGKLFKKELQVGDREFDDAIYIRTDDPTALGGALADGAFRAAVLDAVRTTGCPIVVEGPKVTVGWQGIPADDVPVALRSVALLLHHLERLARGRGLQPRPELAVAPDLRRTLEYLAENRKGFGDNRYWPKGLFFQRSTLDRLDDVVRVHDLQADTGKPLEALRMLRVHLVSGDLSPLAALTTLRVLELQDVRAAGALPPLGALGRLEELSIVRCPLTDLAPLAGLAGLRELWLRGTPVSDLRPLGGLAALRKLDLRGTAVTDLSPLTALSSLQILWIKGLAVDAEQIAALRRAAPQVDFDPY